jgi:putative serine protease PepD
VVAALVLVGLIATAGTLTGLALSNGLSGEAPTPSIRLASPDEAAAATRSAPPEGDVAGGREAAAEDSQAANSMSSEQRTPETSAEATPEPLPSPDSLPAPAPVADEEPVVAVAKALSPSVVRVEVESTAEFGFGLGSGIVWDADNGYIVTNQHVVEGASGVDIVLSDGATLEGEVIGGSTAHDVAVVQVDAEVADLSAAPFAPASSVRVGQLAVAIGSPLGLAGTVTAGIVSAVRIQVQGGADPTSPVPVEMIQTDAAINRGNSGGALADSQGRVIGMNTMIQTTTGGSIGLGFAVPSDTVELIATRIVNGESLELGYLGISGEGSGDGDVGVTVAEVVAGSPAEDAGLLAGDVIISIDSEPMYDIFELSAAIKLRRPGETVDMTVTRGGDIYIVTAVLDALG